MKAKIIYPVCEPEIEVKVSITKLNPDGSSESSDTMWKESEEYTLKIYNKPIIDAVGEQCSE